MSSWSPCDDTQGGGGAGVAVLPRQDIVPVQTVRCVQRQRQGSGKCIRAGDIPRKSSAAWPIEAVQGAWLPPEQRVAREGQVGFPTGRVLAGLR